MDEAVAVAFEIDEARKAIRTETLKLEALSKAYVRAAARYKLERSRVTDGLASGVQYVIDVGTPDEATIPQTKPAAANIKGLAEGIIAPWEVKMGYAKVEVDVCKAMISAAESDLDGLRSKNKYLSHT